MPGIRKMMAYTPYTSRRKRYTMPPTGPEPLSLRICGWIINGVLVVISVLVVICAQLYWTEIAR